MMTSVSSSETFKKIKKSIYNKIFNPLKCITITHYETSLSKEQPYHPNQGPAIKKNIKPCGKRP